MTSIIDKPLKRARLAKTNGGEPKVDREGGDFSAGLIRGVAVITRGEALGHYQWVDQAAVDQVTKFGKKLKRGAKGRFTHPSLSADGMGKLLWRAKNFRTEGDQSIADVHFLKSAHKTPDGDLAAYVMDLADEDPEAFGISIVFDHDFGAEDLFAAKHKNTNGVFESPDSDNTGNYRHIRIARLLAADAVDDPAANPNGLFHQGQEIAQEADRLCAYALGISKERPTLQHLSADADRLAQFAARFLSTHQLELKAMTNTNDKPATATGVTNEQLSTLFTNFTTELLGKVDERIKTALSTAPPVNEPKKKTTEEMLADERKRVSELFAFSKTSGLSDHEKVAQEAVDKGMSVESFKASLTDRLLAKNQLSKDSGEQGPDPYASFRKEFRAMEDVYRRKGITEDLFIRGRCRDEGMPVPEVEKAAAK